MKILLDTCVWGGVAHELRAADVISGTLSPALPYYSCHHHPSPSNRATALAMPDVVTPTCRAISAIDNPNPSSGPFALLAGTALILLRRLSSLGTFDPIPLFLPSFLGDNPLSGKAA